MRLLLITSLCVLLVGGAGCFMPLPNKVSHGHKHSAEEIAFLNLPGTTRAEVIATLGTPLFESDESRTLLYQWEETPRFLAPVPHIVHSQLELREDVVEGDAALHGLFIAYNAQGVVEAHEICKVWTPTLQEACETWRAHRGIKQ